MNTRKKKTARKTQPVIWQLRLYVADTTARSMLATTNLQNLCETYLHGRYQVEVVDLVKDPQKAHDADVVALPTLVRVYPGPQKAVIGSLSDSDVVLRTLEMNPGSKSMVAALSAAGVRVGDA